MEEHKTMYQQQHNHPLERTASYGVGKNAFYWRQIYTLDYIVKTHKLFS